MGLWLLLRLGATELVIQPDPIAGKDSYVSSKFPNDNWGTSVNLRVGLAGIIGQPDTIELTRAFLQFDLSSVPPNAEVTSARLEVYAATGFGTITSQITVRPVSQSWNEVTVTWANQPGVSTTVLDTEEFQPGTERWGQWDVTQLVKDWLSGARKNYGVALVSARELESVAAVVWFLSSDVSEAAKRPKLVIQYGGCTGTLKVNIEPAAARTAGAQWRVDGGPWQDSGVMVPGLSCGSHLVEYKTLACWREPTASSVEIQANRTTEQRVTYLQHFGAVRVGIEPQAARDAGAQWRLDGGDWHNSSDVVGEVSTGQHHLEFKPVPGWTEPPLENIEVSCEGTTNLQREYSPGHQPCVATTYLPSKHGYRFANWGGDTRFTIPVLNIEVPWSGRCYGMSARSLDYFRAAIPIPTNNERAPEQEADLDQRQEDASSELPHLATQLGRAMLGADTMAEDYAWLKAKLETLQPWPILLTGPPTKYKGSAPFPVMHVVIAYKICEDYQGQLGRHTIHVYDPNVSPSYGVSDSILGIYEPAAKKFVLFSAGLSFDWFTTCQGYSSHWPPSFSIAPDRWDAPAEGGTRQVEITAARPEHVWTAKANESWLLVLPTRGTGSGTVTVTAQPNDIGNERSGTVTITGMEFRVTQPPGGFPCYATRTLPCYSHSSSVTVSIQVDPPTGTAAYGVEEQPPQGWTVVPVSINEGGEVAQDGKLRWTFIDANARTLRYDATPPAGATGEQCGWVGKANFDGETDCTIGGDSCMGECRDQHPADPNRDSRITLAEAVAYATCYKRQCVWPTPPTPPTLNYVIRAFFLYKKGECYTVDPGTPSADPAKWLPAACGGSRQAAAGSAANSPAPAGTSEEPIAARTLPTQFAPGVSFQVCIAVTPPPDTVAYGTEEELPAGWTADNISDSGEFVGGKVRWVFLDANARNLCYNALPPNDAACTVEFKGVANFNGEQEVAVTGDRGTKRVDCAPVGLLLEAVFLPGQAVEIRIHGGSPGESYRIEASHNLDRWVELGMIPTDAGGSGKLKDGDALETGYRFYRARLASDGPRPGVSILKPETGERLVPGDTYRIKWRAANIANPVWKYVLDKNGDSQEQLTLTAVNDGNGRWHADWTVPKDLASACDYDLWVKDDSTGVDDHSEFFCVGPLATPRIAILHPTASEPGVPGQILRIAWQAENIPNPIWKFALNKATVHQFPLSVTPVHDDGNNWHADWTVPEDLAEACDYDIWVKDDSTVTDDHSEFFCTGPIVASRIDWQEVSGISSPGPRSDFGFVWDSARGEAVLFGGGIHRSVWEQLDDTWVWRDGAWTQMTPADKPSPRRTFGMAYDTARQRVVLYGGTLDAMAFSSSDETWEWDGQNWTLRSSVGAPTAREHIRMVYDEARHVTVLFGGWNREQGTLAETWTYDGAQWRQEQPVHSPPAMIYHSLAYDSQRGRVVLFGGATDETWEWDGADWQQPVPNSKPAARVLHSMAYSEAFGGCVLFGGSPQEGEYLNDAWIWNGTEWKPLTSDVLPPKRAAHGLVAEPTTGQLLLFGGYDITGGPDASDFLADTWLGAPRQ